MTRLSDHLRGLADRAPVADSTISVDVASRRIHRQRRLRAGANAAAGLGAAAVIAVAAVNPGAGGNDLAADAAAPDIAGGASDGAMATEDQATRLAWGLCGSYPLEELVAVDPVNSLTLRGAPEEATGGAAITLDATLMPASSGEVETFGPQALVLWNGMVVASGATEAVDAAVLSLTAGEAIEQSVAIDLVDCWEGAPLPGGKYQVIAVQELYSALAEEPALPEEPVTEPGTEPGTIEPANTEPASPDTPVDDGTVTSGGLAADAVDYVRVVSTPVDFAVAGDVPDDPFGQYQPKPVEPVELPDDALTPAAARAEFAARATMTPWAMQKGSQRVVKVNDSLEDNPDTAWERNFFGCTWDSTTKSTVPATSASWDLLGVTASLPGTIDVSYGWVVEGNPTVELEVTNVSGYTLPGYWGSDPNTALMLVRDGAVVAEGYPVARDRDGQYSEIDIAQDSMLSPGETLGGTYLWREVNACSTDGGSAELAPGTYTVVNVQSVYIETGQPYYETFGEEGVPEVAIDTPVARDGAATAGDGGDAAGSSTSAIAPAPVDYDWLELQVWTSLGTVTVS
ncbi:hypothetical protein LGT39_08285 [Demequina sp. TTPB684]|uniref:hypothetical protein n=1 Tax=Demequina sp. TTPB684 TaxID=2881057 RepID=UPI001CF2A79F|nr:hypothetical protein [Demequina sp. TTPB684]MCB2412842.1 hypothetical protein [Demequina sp. TTPB684]